MKNNYFAAAVFFSCFCFITLLAMFAYSGTILPTSDATMGSGEVILMWLAWGGIAAFPIVTAAWILVRLRKDL